MNLLLSSAARLRVRSSIISPGSERWRMVPTRPESAWRCRFDNYGILEDNDDNWFSIPDSRFNAGFLDHTRFRFAERSHYTSALVFYLFSMPDSGHFQFGYD